MRRRRPIILTSVVAAFSMLASGCGGGSPGVASVVPSTTAAGTTQRGSRGGASAPGGTVGGRVDGGAQPFGMTVGNPEQGRKLSACMRGHGEPTFPDPDAQGQLTVRGIDRRSPTFRSALSACRKLLPGGFGQAPSAGQLALVERQLLAFSTCMRAHGIEDFPDPSGGGLPRIRHLGDLDPTSPAFQAAYEACKELLPTGLPGKALGGLAP